MKIISEVVILSKDKRIYKLILLRTILFDPVVGLEKNKDRI